MKQPLIILLSVLSLLVVSVTHQAQRGQNIHHSFDAFDSAPYNPLTAPPMVEYAGQGTWSFTIDLGDRALLAADSGKEVGCFPTSFTYTGNPGDGPLGTFVLGAQFMRAYQPWRWSIPEVIGECSPPSPTPSRR